MQSAPRPISSCVVARSTLPTKRARSSRRSPSRATPSSPLAPMREESIPLETAVDAYTINAAYALKQDKTTGSLEPSKRADLVVLDRDIFTIDPKTIDQTKVLATY